VIKGGKGGRSKGYVFVLVFGILTAAIVGIGVHYHGKNQRDFRIEMEGQLRAIAELKVDDLMDYRRERLGNAAIFYKNTVVSALVRSYFEHPEDTDSRDQLRTWLGHFQAADQADAAMYQAKAGGRNDVAYTAPEEEGGAQVPNLDVLEDADVRKR